ncbi:serine/threonine protein phosphatase 1 [Flavobacterium micromati]|jgi:serine/threonine protein phosphatase 1|uniref:Serine/threonine protein phosphatase 1 n=1 Tax=Flavobacterium micromati TaxID=229205 RepID=A0A1M5G4C8_9FLAO|nr:metallophosphoesterase [Flavobacterium micromati]MCL6462376.1 serine/threonine protein phosphatase [Flavobacterium micromati]SHF98504.1 serine/threonine protein phosphatase 1 [Flavobacterium micromati]
MRTLVIGDIHGGLRALHQIMERAKVTKTDTLIFLGDYVDGWSQSPQVIDFIIDLKSKQKCICMRGNHDDLLLEWLTATKDNILWYKHGGEATVNAYKSVSIESKIKHIEFLQSLENYYLDEKHRLFVHAGFTNMNGVDFEYFPGLFYWDRTLWETALSLDVRMLSDHPFYPKRFTLYDEIYIGHTPVTRIGKTTPVQKANIWNVDTGAAFKGPLTIMDVDTKEFWQSEPLHQLYFDEKGRN